MHRLDLVFAIGWEGTWHVGSGFGAAQADRLIQRRGGRRGIPFVPGSQLKGILRHQVERLAAVLDCPVVACHAMEFGQQVDLVHHFGPLERSRLVVTGSLAPATRASVSTSTTPCLRPGSTVASPVW